MRILYHHRTLGDGAEGIHINEMVRAFRRLGHEVEVVALIGDQSKKFESSVPASAVSKPQRWWTMISHFLPGIAYELAEIAYNVLAKRKIEAAIHKFKPDFIYDRYNSFSSAAVSVGRGHGITVFLEVNAPVAFERTEYEHRSLTLNRFAQKYERWICNQADHIFAVSTPLKEFLIQQRDVPESHVTVVPNGVDPKKFDPATPNNKIKQRLRIENKTVIGFVGILRPWHGIEMLIDAFQTVLADEPNCHLLIVGEGAIEESLKEQVSTLGLEESVSFAGRVPHCEISKYIAAMDIAISPKSTFYASPMKILEYMAMKTPTVAPDMANIQDIICDGENGVLFEPDNRDSLAQAITKLMMSPDLVQQIGENARRTVEIERNWIKIAQVVLDAA